MARKMGERCLRQSTPVQFVKYTVSGGVSFLIDSGLLFVLATYVQLHYIVAATLSFICGLIVNYLLAIYWVFDESKKESRKEELLIYGTIGVVGLALNDVIIYSLTEATGIHFMVSKIVAAIIVLVFNFSLRKYYLFK